MMLKNKQGVTQQERQLIYDLFDGTEDYYQWPTKVRPETCKDSDNDLETFKSKIFIAISALLIAAASWVETADGVIQ